MSTQFVTTGFVTKTAVGLVLEKQTFSVSQLKRENNNIMVGVVCSTKICNRFVKFKIVGRLVVFRKKSFGGSHD